MTVYFDNAATSPLDPAVFEAMEPYYTRLFGNPSSTHSFGREAKSVVETSRRLIADMLHVSPGEIFFTSGGTEADNTALRGLVNGFEISTDVQRSFQHAARYALHAFVDSLLA